MFFYSKENSTACPGSRRCPRLSQRPTHRASDGWYAPVNTLGIRRLLFAVEDIKEVLVRLRAHGAEGILIALAEPLR